jgi:tetratricopeptide (TPR) repeat protein
LGCATPAGYQPTGFVPNDELRIVRLVNQGVAEFSRSRFEEAEFSFQEALALKPEDKILKHNLAITHFRLGAYDQAELALRELLLVSPEPTERLALYFELGSLFAAQFEFERSLAFLELALSSYKQQQELLLVQKNEPPTEESLEDMLVEVVDNGGGRNLPLVVLLEALVEVAWKGGDYSKARCYAQQAMQARNLLPNVDYATFIGDVRTLIGVGYSQHGQFILQRIVPKVLVERNPVLAHSLALTFLEQDKTLEFVEWEKKASQAFEINELILRELEHLGMVMQRPGEVELPSVLEQQILLWPARARELQFTKSSELSESELTFWSNLGEQLERFRAEED